VAAHQADHCLQIHNMEAMHKYELSRTIAIAISTSHISIAIAVPCVGPARLQTSQQPHYC
jgi:hypothetical protein